MKNKILAALQQGITFCRRPFEALADEVNAGEDNGLSGIFAGIGSSVSAWVIEQGLTVENHFVYSVGKFNTGKEVQTVSVGVFGHVFTFSKEDLDKALESYK